MLESHVKAASTACAAFTFPCPQTWSPSAGSVPVSSSSRAVDSKMDRMSAGVSSGLASSINATTPATAGPLMLVPDNRANSYSVPSKSTVLVMLYPPSRNELRELSTLTPGADTLGFRRSSRVGPYVEKFANVPPTSVPTGLRYSEE